MYTWNLNESQARYNFIDPQDINADWDVEVRRQVGLKIPVDRYDKTPVGGLMDYGLHRQNGEILAVIEAKRTRRDAKVGKKQVLQYVTKIGAHQFFRPFAFMANGENIWFWCSKLSAESQIAELTREHPTIQKQKNGQEHNTCDLAELGLTLETELENEGLPLTAENIEKAFRMRVGNLTDLLQHALGLQQLPTHEELVKWAFDAFILEHNYKAYQTRFLRTVQQVFLQPGKIELNDLYEHPFSQFGVNAVVRLFDITELSNLFIKIT